MKFVPLKDLQSAHILLTNDDGINSPALKLLEQELAKICRQITVVAPCGERSGSSHAISAEISDLSEFDHWHNLPKEVRQLDCNHFCIDGTPADCVNVAVNLILPQRPDMVVSGINIGKNLAEDVTYSGTVGGAIEGLLNGVRAIAFSQHIEGRKPDWEIARHYIAPITTKLAAISFDINTLINVNFPNIPLNKLKGITIARHGERRFPNKELFNHNLPDDYEVIEQNEISITPIKIDYTDYDAVEKLQNIF